MIAGHACNLDYVRPALSPAATYHALYPKYSSADAFGPGVTGALRGHITLFQNLADEYASFAQRELAQKHYNAVGQVQR